MCMMQLLCLNISLLFFYFFSQSILIYFSGNIISMTFSSANLWAPLVANFPCVYSDSLQCRVLDNSGWQDKLSTLFAESIFLSK